MHGERTERSAPVHTLRYVPAHRTVSNAPGQAELLPRYLFALRLIEGRRVLELGAVSSTDGLSALFLSRRGARTVVACDASTEAIARAEQTLGNSRLQFRIDHRSLKPQSFDVVLVADLAPLSAESDLEDVTRLLDRDGYFVGGLRTSRGPSFAGPPARGGPTREVIVERLAKRFASIQIVRQAVAGGYQLAVDGAAEVKLDGSLAGELEPAYFVFVAGPEPAPLSGVRWIQLPSELTELALRRAGSTGHDPELVKRLQAELHETRIELVNRQAEVHELSRQLGKLEKEHATSNRPPSGAGDKELLGLLETAHAQLKRAAEELRAAQREALEAQKKLAAAEARYETEAQERAQLSLRCAELTARLDAVATREAQTDVGQMAELARRCTELSARVDELQARLAAESSRAHELEAQLATETARVRQLEEQLATESSRTETLKERLLAAEAERERLETHAGELEGHLASQRAELRAREQTVAQLQQEIEGKDARLDALSTQLGEVHAALDSREARVGELERRLTSTAAELDRARARISELQADLARADEHQKQVVAAVERQVKDVEAQKAAALASADRERARVRELEAALEQERANLRKLESRTQSAESAAEESRRRLAEGDAEEVDSLSRQVQSLMREVNFVAQERDELDKKLANEKLERARLERALTARTGAKPKP